MQKLSYQIQDNIDFLTPTGTALSIFLMSMEGQADDSEQLLNLSATVRVTYGVYQSILDCELFNTFKQLCIVPDFDDFNDAPVEVELRLKPSLISSMNQANLPTDRLIELFQPDATADLGQQYLRSTENWLATEFKQQMALPSEFEDFGTLKQGYKTLWSAPASITQPSSPPPMSPQTVVTAFLEEKELTYEWAKDSIAKVKFDTGSHKFSLLIAITPDGQSLGCYSVYPRLLPEEQRLMAAALMDEINYDLPVGNFELDLEDGELRFRTALRLAHSALDVATLDDLVTVNIGEMIEHLPKFESLFQ